MTRLSPGGHFSKECHFGAFAQAVTTVASWIGQLTASAVISVWIPLGRGFLRLSLDGLWLPFWGLIWLYVRMFRADIYYGYFGRVGFQLLSILNGMGQRDTLLYIYAWRCFVRVSWTLFPFIDWVGLYETSGITIDLGFDYLFPLIPNGTVRYFFTCNVHVH